MTDRYTKGLLSVIAVASTLLLNSCSNPDTSGGVTLSKGGVDDANEFPNGSCENPPDGGNGRWYSACGWISVNEGSYYIMPDAKLSHAVLVNVRADIFTVCPNGIRYANPGNNCWF